MTTKESQVRIVSTDGKDFQVREKGSIGLLALGYVGLMAWREKRKQVSASKNKDGQKAGK